MTARENMGKILTESGVYRLTGDSPLDWELDAYAAGFALIEEGLRQAEEDIFAAAAGAERLGQWEQYFLPGPAGCPVEDRQAIVSARLKARPGPVVLADVPELMLAAGIQGTAEEVEGVVKITPETYLLPEAIAQKELALLLPLHWQWEIVTEE